jgi:transcriptional regulator with XRE-family HTH domain
MTLVNYLKRHHITRDEFAALIGVDRVSVWRWENGRAFPLRYIAAITAATGGKVTANDFIRGAA